MVAPLSEVMLTTGVMEVSYVVRVCVCVHAFA